ncbi:hypothetical protein [Nitrolancea hollandica]|uniref:Uncharacterized protein n=1 Tax=Nitrolancea hollandica Lb TaxID=1129897 RepID=I4ED09_9BACT|nr:hypothetical protein [Nitrolancea hollandica]CCF82571.1 exported hypothetical protein [Nitrolancea hollandica Lb]
MRKRSLWSLTLILALLTVTLGATSAATDPLIPPDVPTPDLNRLSCVNWSVVDTSPVSPAEQSALDQVAAEIGKPVIRTRVGAQRCFQTPAEMEQFIKSGAAVTPPWESSPSTALAYNSLAVLWDGAYYGAPAQAYYFPGTCNTYAFAQDTLPGFDNIASSAAANQNYGCNGLRLYQNTYEQPSNNPYICGPACATLGWIDNQA